MSRLPALFAAVVTAALTFPATAAAAERMPAVVTSMLRIGMSLVGLLVAVLLLLEAGRVRQVAAGGAIADKISYVILAILCLAASALARWAQNFVTGVTIEQVQMASEAFVIVAMALLALYFASVRTALRDYMRAMTGSQMLANEHPDESAGEGEGASRG